MGNFYTNITLRGPDQKQALEVLIYNGRSAFVAPTSNGFTVVFDQQCEQQDIDVLEAVASDLSSHFRCPALAILNHDDDILVYKLFDGGSLVDEYDSSPSYFDPEAGPSSPEGGDASKLCRLMGQGQNIEEVEGILRRTLIDKGSYLSEIDRHGELVKTLGIPSYSVGLGYRYIERGEIPEGLDMQRLKHTLAGDA